MECGPMIRERPTLRDIYGTCGGDGCVIFDTDVLIWALRGSHRAAKAIEECESRKISTISYMELIQGARNGKELQGIRSFLVELGFEIHSLSENIGHRAMVYMEEFCLSQNLAIADALIAATAVEKQTTLCTGNAKHFRFLAELDLKSFRP